MCWFAETPLRAGDRVALKQTTKTVRATVQALHTRLDPETLDELDNPVELSLNDIGAVTLRTSSVVVADSYSENRDSGAFILIDETSNETIGAGTIIEPREVKPGAQTRNDIRWHPSALDREHRWPATGQRGATIWFTGLPASGKSTLAVAVERALVESGDVAYLLDGDNIRHGLSDDLGFSAGDRAENIRRVGHLTRLFADAGVVALASLVSPLKSDREIARALSDAAKLPFIEVYICTSVEECEKRDPKGLYAKARSGELKGLTGVDAPYEPPENAGPGGRHHRRRHRRTGGQGARGAQQPTLTPSGCQVTCATTKIRRNGKERPPVRSGGIPLVEHRDQLAAEPLPIRVVEGITHRGQRRPGDPVQHRMLAGQFVHVGGLPGVDGAASVGEHGGVLDCRVDHLTDAKGDVPQRI